MTSSLHGSTIEDFFDFKNRNPDGSFSMYKWSEDSKDRLYVLNQNRKKLLQLIVKDEPHNNKLISFAQIKIIPFFAFNLSANCWMSNSFNNGYYSYHYNHLTTQLFDDLTRSVGMNKNSASESMNRVISQGQTTRSTWTWDLVIHFILISFFYQFLSSYPWYDCVTVNFLRQIVNGFNNIVN